MRDPLAVWQEALDDYDAALAALEKVRAENAKLTKEKRYAELCKAEAENAKLKELAREYGGHSNGCPAKYSDKYPCKCRWDVEKKILED